MAKKAFLGVLIGSAVLFSIGAAPASALTVDEIQSQIQKLFTQIADLTAQLNILRGSITPVDPSVSTYPAMPAQHRICAMLNRNLSHGVQGDDVRSLQEFLYENKFLTVAPTGYFGPMTADAVKRWQAKEGVQAVGSFGPMSRERIKIWCGGGWHNQERFSAFPVRGEAPLTVVFDTWISGFRVPNVYYTLDFGDGSSERAADCPAPADACIGPGQNKHTYTSNGTYTATLNKITDPCAGQIACRAAIHSEVVAKQQISVGQVACTKEYKPVCGSKQVVCITAPCNPIQQTYSNRCMMEADSAVYVHEGQCRTDYVDPAADAQCKSWYDGCNSCSRQYPGGPVMCTLRACMPEMMTKAYCTASFDTATNKPPTISSFSGPTTLNMNAMGTWTIQASDPENGQLSYHVTWGDDQAFPAMSGVYAERAFSQLTTFTHSYAYPGTYTVSINVRDSSGQEAKTSTTVQVTGNTACSAIYQPVCGRPAGCANTCSSGMYCAAICQVYMPQTYSNRCYLNTSGASFLHEGQCTNTSGSVVY